MERMPSPSSHRTLAAAGLVAVLLGSGCGGATGTGGPTAAPGGTSSGTTLERTGGVAGFDDHLEVAADGHVTGTTRSADVDCRVPAETARTLATAPAPTVAPAAGTDRMTVTLRRDSGRVDLGEAQGSDPLSTTARTLLDDVQLPPGGRTLCR